MCGGVGTDQGPAAAQCDDQMLAGNGAAPRVWGAGVWPLASSRQTQAAASSATLLAAADIPHHVISVLQTRNNYLPSRLSSPGTTLHWLVVLVHAIQASLCCLFIT